MHPWDLAIGYAWLSAPDASCEQVPGNQPLGQAPPRRGAAPTTSARTKKPHLAGIHATPRWRRGFARLSEYRLSVEARGLDHQAPDLMALATSAPLRQLTRAHSAPRKTRTGTPSSLAPPTGTSAW